MATKIVERPCERCAVPFWPVKRSRRFCSRSCAVTARLAVSPPRPNAGSFSTGIVPWNKGVKAWRVGYQYPEASRLKMAESQRGPLANNWKGGVSPENERVRKTAAYARWRSEVFSRDDHRCQACGARSRKGVRVVLHADHIQPFATYPALRFEPSNGRTLCEPCHRATPTFGASKRKQAQS